MSPLARQLVRLALMPFVVCGMFVFVVCVVVGLAWLMVQLGL